MLLLEKPAANDECASGKLLVGQYGVQTEPDGLLYMRARYYDPEIGRFISEDPLGMSGGLNLYAYAANNPVMLTDPSGNCPWCAVVGGLVNVGVSWSFADQGTFGLGDAATAFGTGFVAGLVPGLGTAIASRVGAGAIGRATAGVVGGSVGSGGGNYASQRISNGTVDFRQVGVAAIGGGFATAATLPLGTTALEAFSGGVIGSQFGLASGATNEIFKRSGGNSAKP